MIDTLRQPMLRRFYAVAWVTLVSITLLQSSGSPVVGAPAPPGEPDAARELFLTSGHVVAFSVMLVLVWWALRPARHALFAALITCITFGFVTEIAQTLIPDRSASLDDLLVNWIVSVLAAAIIYWRGRSS